VPPAFHTFAASHVARPPAIGGEELATNGRYPQQKLGAATEEEGKTEKRKSCIRRPLKNPWQRLQK